MKKSLNEDVNAINHIAHWFDLESILISFRQNPVMKSLLTLALVSIFGLTSFAQGQFNHWAFGYGAGIDFNESPPVSFSSQLNSLEACAAVSDADGNLLFYTNGGDYDNTNDQPGVWNANHELMPNGDLTNSEICQSSARTPVIVQMPGSPMKYYIIGSDCAEFTYAGGMRYHVVNMELEGGLGDVEVFDETAYGEVSEGIIALPHANGEDAWLVTQDAFTYEILVFSITSAGIALEYEMEVGGIFAAKAMRNYSGTLVLIQAFGASTQLYEFDQATGELDLQWQTQAPGATIDAMNDDGTILYGTDFNIASSTFQIQQVDVSDPDNMTVEFLGPLPFFSAQMQWGPDGKLYIAELDQTTVHVIENPNLIGDDAGLTYDAIDLGTGTNAVGFPRIPVYQHVNPTGIEEASLEFEIYPNPARDQVSLSTSEPIIGLVVVDMLGRNHEALLSGKSLNISNLQTGLYNVIVTANKGVAIQKLLIL